ncbi:MAG: phosphoribosylglycinamide formyltransferase [bacterium]|nr:phosphoribosylglycinamide formyltransferase [bacterium]
MALRVAVLISGSGSTLRNILQRISDGRIGGVEVCGVIASRECEGLAYVRQFDVPHAVVQRNADGAEFDSADFSARVTAQLEQWQPGLLVFGGFLSHYILPPQYTRRAINMHPALLPAFGGNGMYGNAVHRAVLDSGTKVSGCTVHLVTDDYDGGPIIAQRTVAVLDGDSPETLGERVREAERELLPVVIQWFADGRVEIAEDGSVAVHNRTLL